MVWGEKGCGGWTRGCVVGEERGCGGRREGVWWGEGVW